MVKPLSDIALLERLVAFDTTSRNSNLPLIDFLAGYLERPGVRIERDVSPDGSKANLIVTAGSALGGTERSGLLLSGHTDVVPAEEDDWESDPFTLTERGGRYVGRGSADMKGFVALAANALARTDVGTLRHPLALVFTYDEELGTLGARHFAETWPDPERLPAEAVIGEPTELSVVRMHKGYLKLRVIVRGKAAHSGYPHLGRSAIEPAARVVTALAELRRALETERPVHHEHFGEVPYPALNVGRIMGGAAINVVPDRCVIELGVRILPEMERAAMTARVRDAVMHAAGDAAVAFEDIGESPPMLSGESDPLYRRLCTAVGQQDTHAASYATDAGWFQRIGMRCVIWGPGSIEVAHKANEYIEGTQLQRGAEILDGLIADMCQAA